MDRILDSGLLDKLPLAYALHRILCDEQGNPIDYEYLQINAAFIKHTAEFINPEGIIGKRITELIPSIRNSRFDWIRYFGEVALTGIEKEIEQYDEYMDKFFKINVYSPEPGQFVTLFTDITVVRHNLDEKISLLAALDEIVFEVNNRFEFENVITNCEDLLLMPRTEFIGRNLLEVFPGDMGKKFLKVFNQASRSKQRESVIYKTPGEDGDKWYEAAIKHTLAGDEGRYVVRVSEITKTHNLKEQVVFYNNQLESQNRLQEMFIGISAIFVNINTFNYRTCLLEALKRIGLAFNADCCCLVEYDREDSLAGHSSEWFADSLEKYASGLRDSMDACAQEWSAIHGAGKDVCIGDTSFIGWESPVRDILMSQGIKSVLTMPIMIEGDCYSFIAMCFFYETCQFSASDRHLMRVIANTIAAAFQRIRTDRQLEENERLYRHITENISDVVWMMDLNFRITYVSASVLKVFRYDCGEYMGIRLQDKHPQSSLALIYKTMEEELENDRHAGTDRNRSRVIEVEQYRSDGSILWISMNVSFVRDPDGKPKGILGVSRDITDRKATEMDAKKRIDVLTQPVENADDIQFDDLFSMNQIQKLQDEFADATGVSSIITGNDGVPITKPSNPSRLCGGIIQQIPENCRRCHEHDAGMDTVFRHEPRIRRCPAGGVWNASSSIIIGGRHVADWHIGQVRDTDNTVEAVKRYTRKIGPDEQEALDSYLALPLMSHEQFAKTSRLLHSLAKQISACSYKNILQARAINERNLMETAILSRDAQKEAIIGSMDGVVFELSNDCIIRNIYGIQNVKMYCNLNEMIGKKITGIGSSRTITGKLEEVHGMALKTGKLSRVEYCSEYPTGSRCFEVTVSPVRSENGNRSGLVTFIRDITDRVEPSRKLAESEKRYKTVIAVSNTGAWEFNRKKNHLWCSPEYFAMLGFDPSDFSSDLKNNLKEVWGDLLHPADKAMAETKFRTYLDRCDNERTDEMYESSFRLKRKGGGGLSILSRGQALRDSDGKPTGLTVGTHIDVTKINRLEQEMHNEKELFRTTLLSVGDGVISTDRSGKVIILNKIAEQLTGWIQEEAKGRPLDDVFSIISEESGEVRESPVRKVMETGEIVDFTNHTVLISRDGSMRPIEDSAAPIIDKEGQISGVVLVFRDFTEKKAKQDQIECLNHHDQLTNLYNRRFYERKIKELEKKGEMPISVMILDINGLKLTNDAFGHETGDRLIQQVARLIQAECRPTCFPCRTGGDEFTILMPGCQEADAFGMKENIDSAIQSARLDSVIISLAVGIAVMTDSSQNLENTVKSAEIGMYQNKLKNGRIMRSRTIENIMSNVHLRFEGEKTHTDRVSRYCEEAGVAIGMDKTDLEELRMCGLLHDIGKISLPEALINKPEKLTDMEYESVKRHSETGYQIIRSLDEYSRVANGVLCHHERWDGTGYPQKLAGAEIPLISRIVSIADAYESMTSVRHYKKQLDKEEAIQELLQNAGTQFDPELVDIFVRKVFN